MAETQDVGIGWQLVPIEPTEAMMDAFQCAGTAEYRAMLAAAPLPGAESLTEETIARIAFEKYGIVADDAEVIGFAREILGRAMAEMRAKVHELTGTAGKTLVDSQALRDCLMLIDPPPVAKGDGTTMVFVNPLAAQTLTALSAAARRLVPQGE